MKIIHFADLHLGVETYGHPDAASGLNTRFLDFLAAFDKLVDYAVAEKVDLVLFCGDAFKSRDPSQTQQREFARRIRKLADHDIPVFLLIGNHDLPNASTRATSTEIYDTLRIPKVTVASQPKVYNIETASGPLQVAGLPWPRKGGMEGKFQNEGQSVSSEEIKTRIEAVMSSKITQMAADIDPSQPAVMAAHIWVDGAKIGSERKLILGTEPSVMLGNIAQPVFDYVALGHLHKRQVLNETPPVIYSGSLERLDFGEEKDDKGFYIIEIDVLPRPPDSPSNAGEKGTQQRAPTGDQQEIASSIPSSQRRTSGGQKNVKYHFHKLEGRRFLTLEATLDEPGGRDPVSPLHHGETDPTSEVLKLLADRRDDIAGAIVQLKLKMPESVAPLLRDAEIKNALKEAHYFSIIRDVERHNRSRLGETGGEGLSPRQALEKYLDIKNVSQSRRSELLAYAESLLAETEG
ncbi:exonuclease SbcCD subunit D [Dehalogenimonas sp. THU2]|uniref:metallophosphoesterase family protein n=1 Tax=Dehalogenimonas sp. THU2 TaxID=3151121 RepID=UPI00321827B3